MTQRHELEFQFENRKNRMKMSFGTDEVQWWWEDHSTSVFRSVQQHKGRSIKKQYNCVRRNSGGKKGAEVAATCWQWWQEERAGLETSSCNKNSDEQLNVKTKCAKDMYKSCVVKNSPQVWGEKIIIKKQWMCHVCRVVKSKILMWYFSSFSMFMWFFKQCDPF